MLESTARFLCGPAAHTPSSRAIGACTRMLPTSRMNVTNGTLDKEVVVGQGHPVGETDEVRAPDAGPPGQGQVHHTDQGDEGKEPEEDDTGQGPQCARPAHC